MVIGERAPSVSVVVPTHERRELLLDTLGAILGQTFGDLEVIVVDDGSTDGTSSWLAAIGDPRVRWLRHDRPLGVSTARNDGAAVARGRWLAFCDDDDLWAPQKLEVQLHALASSGAGWSCSAALVFDETGRIVELQPAPPSGDLAGPLLATNVVPGGASGVVMERVLFEQGGGFDTGSRVLADYDVWVRLALAAPAVSIIEPLLLYRKHAAAMTVGVYLPAELDRIERRYRRERAERGVRFDDGALLRWAYLRYGAAGARGKTIGMAWQMVRRRAAPPSHLANATFAAVFPEHWRRRRERELEKMLAEHPIEEPVWARELLRLPSVTG